MTWNANQTKSCLAAALLLIKLVGFVAATLPGDLMASSDEGKGSFVIYYLSPQVLTRTRMTPERLKRDAFRLKNRDLPTTEVGELIKGIHTAEHKITGAKVSQYDFRLCISSNAESVWFSSDGKVGFVNAEPFELSSSEEAEVRKLFGELDSLVYTRQKPR